MATDFEFTGRGWIATKRRRKLAWHEHKGVAHYDRERMRQPLEPIHHPSGCDGWSTPLPSWIDPSWQVPDSAPPAADNLDDDPIAETADYVLEACHVETSFMQYVAPGWSKPEWHRRHAMYRYEIRFADAWFRFVSREIADIALAQLLKIRGAKHPRPKYSGRSLETVYFTDRRLAKLWAETPPVDVEPAVNEAAVA